MKLLMATILIPILLAMVLGSMMSELHWARFQMLEKAAGHEYYSGRADFYLDSLGMEFPNRGSILSQLSVETKAGKVLEP